MPRITPVKPRVFIQVMRSLGFSEARQSGSHLSLVKPGVQRPLVVPMHAKNLPVFIVLNNLKTAGISRDEYLAALSRL